MRASAIALYGLLIWFRQGGDPIALTAFPLIYMLGKPWQLSPRFCPRPFFAASLLFVSALIIDSTFMFAVSWISLVYSLYAYIPPHRYQKLLLLAMLGFSWIDSDLEFLGFLFRYTGALATATLFSLFKYPVAQMGTGFLIDKQAFFAEAPCSGLNTLHIFLLIGLAWSYAHQKDSPHFWRNIPLIILLTWLTNTVRMALLTTLILFVSPIFVAGSAHTLVGLFAFCLTFLPFLAYNRSIGYT
ncbi:MAG: exosortase/archaeosortase family protein [Chlamydiia bacterium]|nr:exosortase/archaeosortase family protein [Chlamydiia bacterium]